ncbi:HvfC/BufC N-terminal domain-containing protein [Balneatrix alpica]|uniref:HvfC/BufC N-terminal domain-containing protein n=1 Tax=Balneatrix alpica TaxID=75684 RepID=UPI002738B9CF|nr:DNA-binding domain-containing protein [Balneatrix alpica]
MTTSLAASQARLLAAIREQAELPSAWLVDAYPCTPDKGLAVYRNNRRILLKEMLRSLYPTVAALVGEAYFAGLIHAYVMSVPSRSGDVHRYGEQMADFIAQYPGSEALPYLADVARLEWAWHRSYYAEDSPPFELACLQQWGAESFPLLVFELDAAVQLLQSEYSVLSIWAYHQQAQPSGSLHWQQPQQLLVWRPGRVQLKELSGAEWQALQAMAAGLPLEQVVERALQAEEEFDIQAKLLEWIQMRVIAGVHLPPC